MLRMVREGTGMLRMVHAGPVILRMVHVGSVMLRTVHAGHYPHDRQTSLNVHQSVRHMLHVHSQGMFMIFIIVTIHV